MKSANLYRILTEAKNLPKLSKLVDDYFKGSTVIPARGRWEGEAEKSLVIEIVTEKENEHSIEDLARAIKRTNNQEAVLIQKIQSASYLV